MNVKELIEKLSSLNPDLPVVAKYYDEQFDFCRYDEIRSTVGLVVSKYPTTSSFDFCEITEDGDPFLEQVSVLLLHVYAQRKAIAS